MRSEKGGEEEKEKQQRGSRRQKRGAGRWKGRTGRKTTIPQGIHEGGDPLRIWKEEGESDRQRTKQWKQSSLKTTGEEKEESR